MAAGDAYINCENNSLGVQSLFKKLVNTDINGKPYLNINSSDDPPPVEGNFLLKEDGFYLLQEDGFKIIL